MEILAIYSENHIKTTETRCQHSAVFLNAKADSDIRMSKRTTVL